MTIPVAQAPVSHEWCARRLPRLRRPRRLRRPGGMSQIGKIRKGPFLILPICTTPPGGACGGRGGHGAMSAFSRPSIRRLNAQPEGRGWSRREDRRAFLSSLAALPRPPLRAAPRRREARRNVGGDHRSTPPAGPRRAQDAPRQGALGATLKAGANRRARSRPAATPVREPIPTATSTCCWSRRTRVTSARRRWA